MTESHAIPVRRPRFFYGWVVVPVAMLASICTLPGQSVCVGAFNNSILTDLKLTKSEFSMAYAIGTILAAMLLPVIGALMDRFGIRSAMVGVVSLLAISCCVMANANGLVWLLGSFFLLRLFGQGALSLLANNTMAMWFHRHLGKVAGTCSVIVTFCFALSPLVVRQLIEQFEWRTTYVILGVAVAVIMLPLLLTIFRSRPEDVGQLQDGDDSNEPDSVDITKNLDRGQDENPFASPNSVPGHALVKQQEFTIRQALSHRSYLVLLLIMTSWAMIGTAFIFDVQSFAANRKATLFEPEVASFVFFAFAATMQLVGGVLADCLPLHRLITIAVGGMLASTCMLFATGNLFFVSYAMFGMSQGLLVSVGATIWVRYYGRTHLGKIKGGAMMAMVGGSSIGPLVMGIAIDQTGTYTLPLVMFAILAVICFAGSLFLRSPQVSENSAGT